MRSARAPGRVGARTNPTTGKCDNLTVVIRFFPESLSLPQFPPLRTTDVQVLS